MKKTADERIAGSLEKLGKLAELLKEAEQHGVVEYLENKKPGLGKDLSRAADEVVSTIGDLGGDAPDITASSERKFG